MKEVISYNVTDAAIEKLESEYMGLKVENVEDKENFKLVVDARKHVQKKIKAVEEKRVELKAESLEYGRKVDSEAKRITSKLSPIKEHLKSQEDIIKNEKKRIADEKERQIAIKRDNRAGELAKYEAEFDGVSYRCGFEKVKAADLGILDDEVFFHLVEKAKETKQRKDEQKAKEARLKGSVK